MIDHHRTWTPFILIGCTILGVIAFIFLTDVQNQTLAEDIYLPIEQQVVMSSGDYESAISMMFNEVDIWTADHMYEALLEMRIPAEYRDLHLRFVIAIENVSSGRVQQGMDSLEKLGNEYPWLLHEF